MELEFVCKIYPARDSAGSIITYAPQERYANKNRLPLHRYGQGNFCRLDLRIDDTRAGTYAIKVDGQIMYVGECQDLVERFGPRGYGMIAPRNCFQGGQITNCRINKEILAASEAESEIGLWFKATEQRKRVEKELLRELRPPWNTLY